MAFPYFPLYNSIESEICAIDKAIGTLFSARGNSSDIPKERFNQNVFNQKKHFSKSSFIRSFKLQRTFLLHFVKSGEIISILFLLLIFKMLSPLP